MLFCTEPHYPKDQDDPSSEIEQIPSAFMVLSGSKEIAADWLFIQQSSLVQKKSTHKPCLGMRKRVCLNYQLPPIHPPNKS